MNNILKETLQIQNFSNDALFYAYAIKTGANFDETKLQKKFTKEELDKINSSDLLDIISQIHERIDNAHIEGKINLRNQLFNIFIHITGKNKNEIKTIQNSIRNYVIEIITEFKNLKEDVIVIESKGQKASPETIKSYNEKLSKDLIYFAMELKEKVINVSYPNFDEEIYYLVNEIAIIIDKMDDDTLGGVLFDISNFLDFENFLISKSSVGGVGITLKGLSQLIIQNGKESEKYTKLFISLFSIKPFTSIPVPKNNDEEEDYKIDFLGLTKEDITPKS